MKTEAPEFSALPGGDRQTPVTADGEGERVDLPITGMTCAACARRIERKLSKAPGVQKASVNFATARATVAYDAREINVGGLVKVVKDVGYGATGEARADFIVDDSARPAGSSLPLENYLSSRRGVVSANFNLGTMEVRVEYLPNATDVAGVRRAIEEFGYRVRDVASGAKRRRKNRSKRRAMPSTAISNVNLSSPWCSACRCSSSRCRTEASRSLTFPASTGCNSPSPPRSSATAARSFTAGRGRRFATAPQI